MRGLNAARKFFTIKNAIGFMLIGLAFVVFGIFALSAPRDEYLQTEATIVNIEEYYEDFGSDRQLMNRVYIDYEVDGVKYENVEFNAYDSSMKVGGTVTIEYSPEDPTVIQSTGDGWMLYIFILVGAIAFVGGVISLVRSIRLKTKDMNEYDKVDMSKAAPEEVERIQNNDEPRESYFFHYAGKMNQSYVLEDKDGRAVYEAKLIKFNALKPCPYDFINHLTLHTERKELGKTVSKSIGTSGFGYSVPISAAFTVDGVSNWDYLASKGYGFEFIGDLLVPCFNVKHYGVSVAKIETTGTNTLRGKDSIIGKLPVNGLFNVECGSSELDGVFMTCLSISRAIFYENN